jgi:Na+-driven multidrug efflux pump
MGIIPLCIHTIAYNLTPVLFMIPLGFGIGMSVRMGHVLAHDVHRAKTIAATCMAVVALVAVLVAILVYHLRKPIVSLFSDDEQVMKVQYDYCVQHS